MRSCLFSLVLLFTVPAAAQFVNELERHFSNAIVEQIIPTPTGDLFLRGYHRAPLQLGDLPVLPVVGVSSHFVAKRAANGQWLWLKSLSANDGIGWPTMDLAPNGELVLSVILGAMVNYDTTQLISPGFAARILRISPTDGSLLGSVQFPCGAYIFYTKTLSDRSTAFAPHFDFMGAYMEFNDGSVWPNNARSGVFIMDAQGTVSLVAGFENDGYSMMEIAEVFPNDDLLLRVNWGDDPATFQGLTLSSDIPGLRYALIRMTRTGEVVWHLQFDSPTATGLVPTLPALNAQGQLEFLLNTSIAGTTWSDITFNVPGIARVFLSENGELLSHQMLAVSDLAAYHMDLTSDGGAYIADTYAPGVSQITGFPQPLGADVAGPYLAHIDAQGNIDHVDYLVGGGYVTSLSMLTDDRCAISIHYNEGASWANAPLPFVPGTSADLQPKAIVTYAPTCLGVVVDSIVSNSCDPPNSGELHLRSLGGSAPHTWNWTDGAAGPVRTGLSGGVYSATVSDAAECEVNTTVYVPGPAHIGPLAGLLSVQPFFRPGMLSTVRASIHSPSCEPVDAEMRITLDPRVEYVSGLGPDDALVDAVLVLRFNGLTVESTDAMRELVLRTLPAVQMSEQVCFQVELLPLQGDPDILYNHFEQCHAVVNSHDPNDKTVIPQGAGPEGTIGTDVRTLDYLIRFQNTGNAPAFNVFIDDTLDTDLDLSGLQVIDHSHPMEVDIRGRVLRFRFDDIMLPDSVNDEPNSHGYVAYRIPIRSDAVPGTVITNTAHIFFDLNPAVVTNTTINTIALPTTIGEQGAQGSVLHLHPNPTTDRLAIHSSLHASGTVAQVFDQQGRSVLRIPLGQERTTMDTHMLDAGVYILRVGAHSARFVKVDP